MVLVEVWVLVPVWVEEEMIVKAVAAGKARRTATSALLYLVSDMLVVVVVL